MVRLKHSSTGVYKECTTGYSWTMFFFGVLVPLLRGDLKYAGIVLITSILLSLVSGGVLGVIVGPAFAFAYNKLYITDLVEKGYVGATEVDQQWLMHQGIIVRTDA